MKLYGVTHGGAYEFGGFALDRWQVNPAPEILDNIAQLPSNSTVAVEAVEEAFEGLDMQGAAFQEKDLAYWEEIIEASRRHGHSVVYLDDLSLHIESAKKYAEATDLERILLGLSEYSVAEGKERDVEEVKFALKAVSDYIFKVRREDVIFERLRTSKPDVAVIGVAHGDQLILTPNLATELGVTGYWHGIVPAPRDVNIFDIDRLANIPWRQYLELGEPDPAFVGEREQAIRWYRAATLGRVTVGEPPALIGSWEVSCRPYGLFEVHVDEQNGNNFRGTIIDTLGDAPFSGYVTDSKLRLVKEYDPSRALAADYLRGKIIHDATADSDGLYTGTWYSDEHPEVSGELVITSGHELYTPPPISPQLQLF